ncbi:hypothetical protein BDP27DRAFT_1316770 [Rhodocollybia butyracea]|uniref:Uncharacterized protein n=1 Tax=Rhodocollybia butyracea TaxID=206335 RepID=A0A9P5UDZ4_9AGAR|nr:hypothetical protein BDP27DRAFT_1316770 [Rhodocollybia butyracea]
MCSPQKSLCLHRLLLVCQLEPSDHRFFSSEAKPIRQFKTLNLSMTNRVHLSERGLIA